MLTQLTEISSSKKQPLRSADAGGCLSVPLGIALDADEAATKGQRGFAGAAGTGKGVEN